MKNDAGHRANTLHVIAFNRQAQARAGATGQTAHADVAWTHFDAKPVNPVIAIGEVAVSFCIDPGATKAAIDQATVANPEPGTAADTMLPVDIAKALGAMAFDADEQWAQWQIGPDHAFDLGAIGAFARCARKARLAVKAVVTTEDAEIGFDAERL